MGGLYISTPESRAKATARAARLRASNPEKYNAYQRARYKKNRESNLAAQKIIRQRNKERLASQRRGYRGLPKPTRPEPRTCECCGGPPPNRTNRLNLDHDHETGEFRGWLCHRCNLGIGWLGDNAEGLVRALKYLWREAAEG